MAGDQLISRAAEPMPVWDKAENPCPPLNEDEYASLRQSLSNNGFVAGWPIVRSAGPARLGELIDGFHRSAICAELGVEPVYAEVECATDTEFHILRIMANVSRRQLTTTQRAFMAVSLIDLYAERARERMAAGADRGRETRYSDDAGVAHRCATPEANLAEHNGTSAGAPTQKAAAEAAQAVGVSPRTVEQALAVTRDRPDLVSRVERGDLSIKAAYTEMVADRDQDVRKQSDAEAEIAEHWSMDTAQAKDEAARRLLDTVVRLTTELDLLIRKNGLIEGDVIDYSGKPHTFKGTVRRVGDFLVGVADFLDDRRTLDKGQ